MKLTKVTIRRWLEGKRDAQLSELRNQNEKERKDFRLDFVQKHGFTTLFEKYGPIIQEFKKEYDAIYDKLIDDEKLEPTCHTLTGDRLRNLLSCEDNFGDAECRYMNITEEDYVKLEDKQDDELRDISQEWAKLISNVNNLNSVKKILTYLNDLGIDTSEITPVDELMLPATPIQVSVLKLN